MPAAAAGLSKVFLEGTFAFPFCAERSLINPRPPFFCFSPPPSLFSFSVGCRDSFTKYLVRERPDSREGLFCRRRLRCFLTQSLIFSFGPNPAFFYFVLRRPLLPLRERIESLPSPPVRPSEAATYVLKRRADRGGFRPFKFRGFLLLW